MISKYTCVYVALTIRQFQYRKRLFVQDEVGNPASYVILEFLFPNIITPTITATCQLFECCFHLVLGFGVHCQKTLSSHYIKGVAQELTPLT